ncbi:MAG: dephospho-CoA kinase [Ruminococcaceae bacterium]|nr:dephospho-CoA kinase [Oscillospiraceae bacterium]
MKKVAICGPSGVGKGYISNIISSTYGFPVLDTDQTVHDMYENDGELIKKLALLFGDDVVKEGKIHRPTLRNIVFKDRRSLELLNLTVHKEVRRYIFDWFKKMASMGHTAVFVDIPQIIESGMTKDFDLIIGVESERSTRIKRIIKRDGVSLDDAEKRINNQLSAEEYKKVCHYTINNDGEDVFNALRKIFEEVNLIEKTETE